MSAIVRSGVHVRALRAVRYVRHSPSQVDDITQVTADTALTSEGENKCKSNIGCKNMSCYVICFTADERHCGTCSIYPASFAGR